MEQDLKEVMLETLGEAQDALIKLDSDKLRSISNYTLHYAGIFQDPYSTSVAVIVYSLAKIVERHKERKKEELEDFKRDIAKDINQAINALKKDNDKEYLQNLKDLLEIIGNYDKKLSNYVTEVIEKARIKKGSLIYKHGLSVGRAAELMGVSPWELMDYIGHTRVADEMPMTSKAPAIRLKEARKIFNL